MLYGVLSYDGQKLIKRIPAKAQTAKEIENEFQAQAGAFFNDGSEPYPLVEFQAGQTQSEESILYINDFEDVLRAREAIEVQTKNAVFDFSKDLPYLKGIFMKDPTEGKDRVLFQLVEGRRIVKPGTLLGIIFGLEVGNSNTLSRLDAAGLSLDSKLTAVMEKSNLYFKSFWNANRIFDLSDYLADASEEGTKNFLQSPYLFTEGDPAEMAKIFSKAQMRKIPKIVAFEYLKKYTAEELQKRALKAKPPINLEVKDSKLVVPMDSNARAVLLDFLSNSIFSSHLDDETDYISESFRPRKKS